MKTYLNHEILEAIDPKTYRAQSPFPWVNPHGLLHEEAYHSLLDAMPEPSLFMPTFGRSRKNGQKSHDRFTLKYRDGLLLPGHWEEFIKELRGETYRNFLGKLLPSRSFELDFFWFYTPNGCSISPHCDHKNKVGAHLFYFNTEQDWNSDWGGETLILDDGGQIERKSAPGFDAFTKSIPSRAIGNYSLIFSRTPNSWHGMQEIHCPEDSMRKVFMVAVKQVSSLSRISAFFCIGRSSADY
ncbi:MAG: hypothetical protein ACPGYT_06235 [Nitrospirales bacterium]